MLTPEQFEELWEERGLKYRFGDHYDEMAQRGMRAPFKNFLNNCKVMLREFLVDGVVKLEPTAMGPAAVKWWDKLQRRKE